MAEKDLSIEEIEKLDYYDFMSYLGTPFFQIGGLRSTERLAELCRIGEGKRVLVVGCGTGLNACHIAKKFGCTLMGVDIEEIAVKRARERAESEGLSDRAEFRVGDAYDLSFEAETFDAVLTQFVSQFLDMERALKEFVRVLRPGGCVGINEMFKDEDPPPKIAEEVLEAERTIADLTKLPFEIHTSREWRRWLEEAGLSGVEVHEVKEYMGLKESINMIKAMGGFWTLSKLLVRVTKYALLSRVIRERFGKLSKAKRILLGSGIYRPESSRHVGYVLAVGRKR